MLYVSPSRSKAHLMILNFICTENGYFSIKILLCLATSLTINFSWVLTNNVSKRDYYEKCRVQMQTRCLIHTVKEEKIGQLKYIVMYISQHRLNHYKPVVSYCNYTLLRAKYLCETTFQNDIHFKHGFQFHNITIARCLKKMS